MDHFDAEMRKMGLGVAKLEMKHKPRQKNPELTNLMFKILNDMNMLRHKSAHKKIVLNEVVSKISAIKEACKVISTTMTEINEDEVFTDLTADTYRVDAFDFEFALRRGDLEKVLEYAYRLMEFISYLCALATIHYNCSHFKKELEGYLQNVKGHVEHVYAYEDKVKFYEKYVTLHGRMADFETALKNDEQAYATDVTENKTPVADDEQDKAMTVDETN